MNLEEYRKQLRQDRAALVIAHFTHFISLVSHDRTILEDAIERLDLDKQMFAAEGQDIPETLDIVREGLAALLDKNKVN